MHADYCNPWYYQSFSDDVLIMLRKRRMPTADSIEWNDGVYTIKDKSGEMLMMGGLESWSFQVAELTGSFDDNLPYPFSEEDEGGDLNHLFPPNC